jgi:nucleoside-diphosphate-sugar epimerase
MTPPILVTGGTGRLGRHVVRRLRDAGSNVRVLSRRSREAEDGIRFLSGDLATGEGIKAAVEGVEAIVHLAGTAGSAKGDEDKARSLVRAAGRCAAPGVHLGRWG